jgi:hypothetical protein
VHGELEAQPAAQGGEHHVAVRLALTVWEHQVAVAVLVAVSLRARFNRSLAQKDNGTRWSRYAFILDAGTSQLWALASTSP